MGRSLDNAVLNLGMKDMVAQAMGRLGFSFEDLIDEERDAGLGNGGLGRLAACYMDSSATLNLPVFGYGLRYDYGIFKQLIDENGRQLEAPDRYVATRRIQLAGMLLTAFSPAGSPTATPSKSNDLTSSTT
jgi:starch phosphorylase